MSEWLNLLITMPLYLIMLSLGSLILNLKIRVHHWLLIALIASAVNVGLEEWLGQSLIKVVVPVFVMAGLLSCLLKINLYKSAITVFIGFNAYVFTESIALLISYNFLKKLPEAIMNDILIVIIIALFMAVLGLGIIALIKIFNFRLYNLTQMADNSRENEPVLTALLLFIGIPFLVYCFIFWLMIHTMGSIGIDIILILNIINAIFLVYIAFAAVALRRADRALQRSYKYHADRGVAELLRRFFEIRFEAKEAYVKQMTPISLVPIPQLHLFFQIQYAIAQEKQVDFILQTSDLSGLEAYVDDAFIRMLERLYENAFEAVETAEFKEIYSEIAKDDDGGFTIIIKNNGDVLPKGSQKHPFEFGYTTKNDPDRGYGLYAVKKQIDHYEGSIDLRGTDGYTQATIKLPFKESYKPEQPKRPALRVVKGG